ncbi:MAG TPA: hypothetical protein VN648_30940, partial [Candidatus Methylomirabilis sp.]|nr:hypothetical protein [Candidatus Methylomirabilis sp.]
MDSEPVRPHDNALEIVKAHAEGLARLAARLEVIRADLDGIHRHLGEVGQRLPRVLRRDPSHELRQDVVTLQRILERAQRELVPRLQEAAQEMAGLKARAEEAERRYQELVKRYENTTAEAMRVQEAVANGLQTLTRLETRINEMVRRQEEVHPISASPEPARSAAATREQDSGKASTFDAVTRGMRDPVTIDRVKIDRRLSEIRFTLEATAYYMKKTWRLSLAILFLLLLLVIAVLFRPEIIT